MRIQVTIEIDVADKQVADDFVTGLNYLTPYMGDSPEVTWEDVTPEWNMD